MGYNDLEDLGNGVEVLSQDEVASKTLICYLNRKRYFHYGFAYKNGSNLRLVTWTNGERDDKTVSKGASVIAFREVCTSNSFGRTFSEEDFRLDWFDGEAQGIVLQKLETLFYNDDDADDDDDDADNDDDDDVDEICKGVDSL